jgi:NADPH2:quinone reductase
MDTIRALVADPAAPGHVALREAPAPTPAPSEAVVAVEAVSLNRGEVRALQLAAAGWRPGWDLAGTVVQAAADGSGPPVGTRVVGLAATGAWAERVALPSDALARLPEAVDAGAAATLPVAGLTALRAVELADTVENRPVLVTGASGGVGRFAIQLAAQLGADVTALVSSQERGRPLLELGAATATVGVAGDATFDVILESVGGDVLATALRSINNDGLIVSFGNSAAAPTTFDATAFYRRGGARLYAFVLRNELARSGSGALDLARLAGMVADGHLDVGIARDEPWTEAGAVIESFLRREITGKAVLRITQ